jgi:hypothetical protein
VVVNDPKYANSVEEHIVSNFNRRNLRGTLEEHHS